jgi:hypothetical protein
MSTRFMVIFVMLAVGFTAFAAAPREPRHVVMVNGVEHEAMLTPEGVILINRKTGEVLP